MDVCSLFPSTLPNTFTVGFQTPLHICSLTAWGVTSQIPYGCSHFCHTFVFITRLWGLITLSPIHVKLHSRSLFHSMVNHLEVYQILS